MSNNKDIKDIKTLSQSQVKRAYVKKCINNTSLQRCVVSYQGRPDAPVENINPYGLYSNPPPGSLGVIFNIGGNEQNRVGIFSKIEKQFRPQGDADGVVWLYNPLTGASVSLREDGTVHIVSPENFIATLEKDGILNVTGNLTATVTGTANITSTGNATIQAPNI